MIQSCQNVPIGGASDRLVVMGNKDQYPTYSIRFLQEPGAHTFSALPLKLQSDNP